VNGSYALHPALSGLCALRPALSGLSSQNKHFLPVLSV